MIILTRYAETTRPDGTLAETVGWLDVEKKGFSCRTIERPYRDNKNNVSALPAGMYVAEVVLSSPAFNYPHIWIHDKGSVYAASDRAGVKIHIANYVRQLEGCVAVGKSFVHLDGDGVLDVTQSEQTLEELINHIPRKTTLEIRDQTDMTKLKPAELEDFDIPLSSVRRN